MFLFVTTIIPAQYSVFVRGQESYNKYMHLYKWVFVVFNYTADQTI